MMQSNNLHANHPGRWAAEDAARGREAGAVWARRRAGSEAVERLARNCSGHGSHIQLPSGPNGYACDLFVAMFGRPDIPEGETGAFIHDYIPSPVREFWEDHLGEDGVALANRRAFALAFVASALEV